MAAQGVPTVNKNNSPERIDPVDLIGTNYEAVEMSDVCRLDIQNRTRAVVAARHKMPAIRWAISLAGAAALIVVLALSLHRLPVPPTGKGHGQAQFGSTPPHMVQHHATASQSGSSHVKMAPKKTAPNVNRMAIKPTVKKNAPRAIPVVAPQLGEPMVVVVSVQQPAKDRAGRLLNAGDRVRSGDTIRTGQGGRVTLVTRKGSELSLDSNTALVLSGSNIAAIKRGRLYCSNRDKEIARIDTPAGRVKLLGTVVDTNVVRKDTVAVTVVEGKVELSNSHGRALVDAGKQSTLLSFRPPRAGAAVDTYRETSWYHGRGDYQSDFGDIAYVVLRQKPMSLMTEVWLTNLDGTDKHRIRTLMGSDINPGPWVPGQRWLSLDLSGVCWATPDPKERTGLQRNGMMGRSIVENRVMLLDAATGQSLPSNLPEVQHSAYQSFSPDSTLMAYCDTGKSQSTPGVWVYDRRTGKSRCVYKSKGQTTIAWAPDSIHIAISMGPALDDKLDLLIVNAHTGEVRDLSIRGGGGSFSPDGTKIAYCGDFKQTSAWLRGVPMGGSVFVLDLTKAGAKPVRVSSGQGGAAEPRWSPDGTRIAYMVPTEGNGFNFTICVVNADGTALKEIYHDDSTWIQKISWSPTGDAVFVTQDMGGTILLVAADGSGVKRTLCKAGAPSDLPPDAKQQTDAAADAIKEAMFEFAMGKTLSFDGDMTGVREHFTAAADIFSGLVWNYPLSGLATDDVLRYADVARNEASRSADDILQDSCKQRMDLLRSIVNMNMRKDNRFPTDLQTCLSWAVSRPGGWMVDWLTNKDEKQVRMLDRCPGDGHQGATPFVYTPPAPGAEPKAGDVIVQCPLHPDVCLKWDAKTAERFNTTLLKDGKPGAWCSLGEDADLYGSDGHLMFNLGIPYRFENAGGGPLTIIHHILTDTYEVKGVAKLLPIGRTYRDETFSLGALGEASIARAIDAAGKLDWGSLPKEEIERAQGELDFCRGVAQMEAGQPITACKVIDGEPARLLDETPSGRTYRSCGLSGVYLNKVGSEPSQVCQLKPSGRFRVFGTVTVKGKTCKNGWIDKDGKVISTE